MPPLRIVVHSMNSYPLGKNPRTEDDLNKGVAFARLHLSPFGQAIAFQSWSLEVHFLQIMGTGVHQTNGFLTCWFAVAHVEQYGERDAAEKNEQIVVVVVKKPQDLYFDFFLHCLYSSD